MPDVKLGLERTVGAAAGLVDRALFGALRLTARSRTDPQAAEAILGRIAADYPPASPCFFRSALPIDPAIRVVGPLAGGGAQLDLRWHSFYPSWHAATAERVGRNPRTQWARVRLFAHAEPRPVVLLLHGYASGHWRLERRIWPVDALYASGLDVALFVLPEHAARKDPARRGPPPFPSGDPRLTNEGFRRAIHELVDLMSWLEGRGHPRIGAMGMSLGGYTAALLATVDDRLAALALIVPLGSLADYARDHGLLPDPALHSALERAHACVDPLRRLPLIAPERVRIAAARADRVTPLAQARRLAEHFQVALDTWPGGHIVQLGRRRGFRALHRFFVARLLLDEGPVAKA